MFPFSDKYAAEFETLLAEAKRYFSLERRYWTLDLVEKSARLLSFCVLLLVSLLLGAIALIAGTFALAYWIGSLTDSLAIGFVCVMALVLLVIALVLRNSRQWILIPITRTILNIFISHTDEAHD